MSGGWSTPISGDGALSGGGGLTDRGWTVAPAASGSGSFLVASSSGGVVIRPSSIPDLLAVASLVLSALIAVFTAPEATLERIPFLSAMAAPLATGPSAALVASSTRVVAASVVGYVFTPFAVVAALAWARAAGLAKLDDPWFDRSRLKAQMRRLQALALVAFTLAVPHVLILSRAIQASLGLGS
jgi:hypothetical protein